MRRLALSGVKALAAAADVVRRPDPGIVVLIYHRVGGGSGTQVDLDPALFDAQCAWLASSARVLSLGDALDELADSQAPPAPGVVLTFDDGTVDVVDNAVPILERHRLPMTLYVATDFIEAGRSFPNDGRPASWAGLADSVATGLVDIGSHTHTHLLLDRVDGATAAAELDRSIELIGERLGVTATDFAYPKAVGGSVVADEAVRARFRSAAVAGSRANLPGRTDAHRLARTPVQVVDGTRWFERKVRGGMALEDDLRQRLNRNRYADAVT